MLTLSEVARRAGVSMATAQRYKKLHQDLIPTEGEGRRQRYGIPAVKMFRDWKKEGVSKRGATGPKRSPAKPAKAAAGGAPLLTLSSISGQTGISYPTLQRYVKLFGDRIPHEGEGRKRRYHPDSVAVFLQLRAESKPGRKPKAEAAEAPKAPARKRKAPAKAAPRSAPAAELLTLTAIGKQTGISGPTLQRYIKLHLDRIPHEGEGRKRRYRPEAVEVFNEIRSQSKRGRKPKAAEPPKPKKAPAPPSRRKAPAPKAPAPKAPAPRTGSPGALSGIESRLATLEAQVSQVLKKLEEPITITLRTDR